MINTLWKVVLNLFQTTNFRLLNWKSLQTTISNLMKVTESSPNGKKTLWEKEKLIVRSNFSFFQCFQKTYIADTYKPGLVWERINAFAKKYQPMLAWAVCAGWYGRKPFGIVKFSECQRMILYFVSFLAHLSTTCSIGSFSITVCQLCIVWHALSTMI